MVPSGNNWWTELKPTSTLSVSFWMDRRTESRQEYVSQTEKKKTKAGRETNSENKCCTKKQKGPPPTYQNPRPVAINNFFPPLRDLSMENVETGSEGNSTKTRGTNEGSGKCRP
jgi:hypothetical protein